MSAVETKGYALEDLSPEAHANLSAAGLEPDDYTVLSLPPAGGMQMQLHPSGAHILVQPVVLPKGVMTWQKATGLMGPDGQPLMAIKPGDIVMAEIRFVVRKDTVCETVAVPPTEPPLPRLVPPQEA